MYIIHIFYYIDFSVCIKILACLADILFFWYEFNIIHLSNFIFIVVLFETTCAILIIDQILVITVTFVVAQSAGAVEYTDCTSVDG